MAHGVSTHPTQEKVLAEKVQALMSWTELDRVIRMSDAVFYHFLLETPRNYSAIVMFTALHKFRSCVICKYAAEEFHILADSCQRPGAFTNKVFFALVDYDENPEAFHMFQVMTVPRFFHFPAKGKLAPHDIYPLEESNMVAEQMAKWVAERTEIKIDIIQPASYRGLFKSGILSALLGGLVYLLKWNRKFIFSKRVWQVLMLCFVMIMMSGKMWTHMNRAPYAQRNPRTGHMQYISEGMRFQFAVETYVVCLLHACVSLGTVLLDTAAASRESVQRRRVMILTGVCLIAVSFPGLLALLRVKVPPYLYGFS
ncbi:Magnesium transporter protein 1 [Tupaia chinensis]|uniref:Magnesium transporter protein 1 n=2 Tax=Tupaia chinensis TaxID=246437 RepID=L9KSW2_TUPCH|nr:Magnesium transporter protein 1 [Tupaia chinensis]